MKYFKRILSIVLVLLTLITALLFSVISTSAITKFVRGDFEYAKISDDIVYVSAYLGEDTDITMPYKVDGIAVVGIYDDCFKNSDITSVEMPNLYKHIGDFAFYGCKSLKTVKIPARLESIGIMAFYGCDALETVDFSEVYKLNSLSLALFSGCKSLKTIELPDCLTEFGENVFVNCESLETIYLPSKLSEIPRYAFYGCSSLKEVDLPISVTSIGQNAFGDNSALEELFIPESVNSFAENAVSDNISIVCYEDSYTAKYCEDNNIGNVRIVKKLLGDADLNGEVNILDVTCIQKYKIGEDTISTYRAEELADVNKDGAITIRDATLIQMYLAKIITEF